MPELDAERLARIQMTRVAEPGDPDACRLVREHSAVALVQRLRSGRLPSPKAQSWAERLAGVDVDAMLIAAERVSARYLVPDDPEWPDGLTDLRWLESAAGDRLAGEPFGLWVRGTLALSELSGTAVAIVGARASTEYGDHVAGSIAAGCAARGRVVVSGGAYGIDAAAHRGALAAEGRTAAVLASGIDRLYPVGHDGLLEELTCSGLLVSEAAPGCAPSRSRFLVRNRLIAALSAGTVVVEAALRSGSLNTARWARDIGRVLMGVPGPVTSMMSAGVHEMLRQPESVLVTDADEVLELVSPIGTAPAPVKQGPVLARDSLDDASRRLLDATPLVAAAPAGSIATIAGMTAPQALERLAELARIGLVIRVANGWRLPPTGPDAP
ncbi:MAG: processing protein [Nocardioidaceae bacterium]|jgi:DNA processing protein|nr:processing protein [Nocardioidaceae bacterium]